MAQAHEEYPDEYPSVYEIRMQERYLPPPEWAWLWVDQGQNISCYRFGTRDSKQIFEAVKKFLDGKSEHPTLKDLYWWAYNLRGYDTGPSHPIKKEK